MTKEKTISNRINSFLLNSLLDLGSYSKNKITQPDSSDAKCIRLCYIAAVPRRPSVSLLGVEKLKIAQGVYAMAFYFQEKFAQFFSVN